MKMGKFSLWSAFSTKEAWFLGSRQKHQELVLKESRTHIHISNMNSVPVSGKTELAAQQKVPSPLLSFPSSLSFVCQSLKTEIHFTLTGFYILLRKTEDKALKIWFTWIFMHNILGSQILLRPWRTINFLPAKVHIHKYKLQI